jgi:phytoene dehydrogenase-like protein
MSDLDAIIVGAGHNGLTCAAYLGMAGLRVRVFERRSVVGGACVTEEFHPGFRNSTAACTVSLLQPKVIQNLKLHERGLRVVERRAQNFLPLPDGRYLLTGDRYPAYQAEIRRVAEMLRSVLLIAPPNLGGFSQAVRELKPMVLRQRSSSSADRQAMCSTVGSNPIPSRQCSASMR